MAGHEMRIPLSNLVGYYREMIGEGPSFLFFQFSGGELDVIIGRIEGERMKVEKKFSLTPLELAAVRNC